MNHNQIFYYELAEPTPEQIQFINMNCNCPLCGEVARLQTINYEDDIIQQLCCDNCHAASIPARHTKH